MSVVRSWLVVATAAACRLSVVSRCRLSVVGRRLPFVGCSSFFIVRCPLTFVASFWLCLQGSPTAPARLGFGQSMYVHTSALYTHRTCVCPAHLLFPREILHMQPRNSVQLCNCATVQLFNGPTVQLSNLSRSFRHGKQELRLPLLSRRRQRLTCFSGITCIFRSICIRGTQSLPQTQTECGISLFARLPGKYFALILAHRET